MDAPMILVSLMLVKHTTLRHFSHGTGTSFICMRRRLGSNAPIQAISRTYENPSCRLA